LAGDEVAEAIGDALVRARRAAIGRAGAGPDRAEAGDFSGLADRLEQGAAAGTQIADQIGPARRAVQAGLAGQAFEVGHQAAFAGVSQGSIHDNTV
jgi:hypothetical protein